MIRVLIADDSNVIKKLIKTYLEKDPLIKVIDFASNGIEACEKTFSLKPDVVLMDINMPGNNGYDATQNIMYTQPTPVIMITSDDRISEIMPKVLKSGAVSLIKKPKGFDYSVTIKKIISEIKSYARANPNNYTPPDNLSDEQKTVIKTNKKFIPKIICIGSSTGGPDALVKVLSGIKIKLDIPIVIIQHITAGFNNDLVKWLSPHTQMQVKIAEHNEKLLPGVIYIPTDNAQLLIQKDGKCYNSYEPLHPFICPSVDVTFKSIVKVFGENCLGVILTGMGKDGAEGLSDIYNANGYTIAQDKESSVIFGMPKAAISRNIVKCILDVNKIGKHISEIYLNAYGNKKQDLSC